MGASQADRKVFNFFIEDTALAFRERGIYKLIFQQHVKDDRCLPGLISKSFPQRPDPTNPVCCGSDALMPGDNSHFNSDASEEQKFRDFAVCFDIKEATLKITWLYICF